jgi:hypothetical protein
LLLTYVIPVAPLVVLFDGIVSCLRTYTKEELLELTSGLGGSDYVWQLGVERVAGQPLTWLSGAPRET